MNETFVHSATDGAILHITIDRQDKFNALNRAVLAQLQAAFETAAGDSDIRCVVLGGAGSRAFVAGADIGEIQALGRGNVSEFVQQGHMLMHSIEMLGKPVIAAINGFALGGGCELALACTLRIAASTAQLGLPEVGLGLIPGFGGTQRLSRLIGRGRALEMMLTGVPINAEQAKNWGLVNAVAEPENLAEAVNRLASKLARSAPCAMRAILKTVHGGADLELAQGLALETEQFAQVCATEDMQEGTSAFLQKRKPEFKGK